MNYITPPPRINNIPNFLLKRISIPKLIRWATVEYFDMLMFFEASGEYLAYTALRDKHSLVDFIAHTKAFEILVSIMNQELWESLDKTTRNTLADAKMIYDNKVKH